MLRPMRRHVLSVLVLIAATPSFGAGFVALSLPGSQLVALSADGRAAAGGLVGGASGGFHWREGAPVETSARMPSPLLQRNALVPRSALTAVPATRG